MSPRRAVAAVVLLALAACGDEELPLVPVPPLPAPTTEFITRARVWNPGERAALIARIQRTRQLSLPYAGDLSDNADQILPRQTVYEIIPNPDFVPLAESSPFGPAFSMSATRVPGTGWTTFGLDIHQVNNNQAGDTFDWLGAIWFSDADSTWKGLILAATASGTLGATTVNTPAFDAANAKAGVGAGEARASNGTFWQANGTGSPNQFSVTLPLFFGGTTTITEGPYTGGTQQTGLLSINVNNVGMTRLIGAGTPINVTASVSGLVGAVRFNCIYPTPCTGDVAALAAARAGNLPDSLAGKLPWVARLETGGATAAGRFTRR